MPKLHLDRRCPYDQNPLRGVVVDGKIRWICDKCGHIRLMVKKKEQQLRYE